MATYKLIPSVFSSSNYSYAFVEDASNALHDTSNTGSSAWGGFPASTNEFQYLGGFGLGNIPSGEYTITVKVKAYTETGYSGSVTATLYSSTTGIALSSSATLPVGDDEAVTTLTLTATADTILAYGDTVCIKFNSTGNGELWFGVKGAEINITPPPSPNKILYGNKTLIDLTGDTATASDVASGKTFHLANGNQATGTLSATSPSVATATTSSSTARTVSFTVSKEPSWFMMICSDTNQTSRAYRVQHMLYDGTTTTTYYTNNSVAGSIATNTSFGSFTYSSGTLTITVKTAPYIGAADWELYYL